MDSRFDFKKIEEKWSEQWSKADLYKTDEASNKKKEYVLVEFPYPSGSGLHIGHAFTMTGADIYARLHRMKGDSVLFPMGWDAFGLPTENYAIKNKIKPQDATLQNVARYKSQMNRLAFSFDWSREVNTTDSDYYKWTQWIFIQLFKKGLAYKEEMPINWCPSCKTGLANEEVVDGKCERCGAEVYRRDLSQWIVKITDYADRLIEGLKSTDFVEKVKAAQINWIDRSEGAEVDFHIDCTDEVLTVFTTRPDTLWGATFMVVAPEHKFVSRLLDNPEIKAYVESARKKSELERSELQKEKTGVFTGFYAINPVNNKKIPVWVSDFVLSTYGTGAIMAVPAHDGRDFDFAKKFNLPIIPVIEPKVDWDFEESAYTDVKEGKVINSDLLNGLSVSDAKSKIINWLKEKSIGKVSVNYHLRDWIFSRQHYWGEPIPMINCPKCGWVPEKEENLPIKLPEVEHYEPTDTGKSPLSNMKEWVETTCPVCGGKAERETDTMPNWAGSDWYFLRYIDPKNDKVLADWDKMKKWLPVDVYVGGDEHNTLHLLYSRFINNFLFDIGAVPVAEPYYKRLSHGVILGPDGQRMSKSRGNVIVPDNVADQYGVDVVRTYLMFMGPFTGTMAWNEKTLSGVVRFINRFYSFVVKNVSEKVEKDDPEVLRALNKTIKKVGEDIESFHFNTAVAGLMEMLNVFEKKNVSKNTLRSMIKLLSPFAPYTSEELWQLMEGYSEFSFDNSVHTKEWPIFDEKLIEEDSLTIAVQINGKVRGTIVIQKDDSEELVKEKALTDSNVARYLEGKSLVKFIYIPGKIVNIVI